MAVVQEAHHVAVHAAVDVPERVAVGALAREHVVLERDDVRALAVLDRLELLVAQPSADDLHDDLLLRDVRAAAHAVAAVVGRREGAQVGVGRLAPAALGQRPLLGDGQLVGGAGLDVVARHAVGAKEEAALPAQREVLVAGAARHLPRVELLLGRQRRAADAAQRVRHRAAAGGDGAAHDGRLAGLVEATGRDQLPGRGAARVGHAGVAVVVQALPKPELARLGGRGDDEVAQPELRRELHRNRDQQRAVALLAQALAHAEHRHLEHVQRLRVSDGDRHRDWLASTEQHDPAVRLVLRAEMDDVLVGLLEGLSQHTARRVAAHVGTTDPVAQIQICSLLNVEQLVHKLVQQRGCRGVSARAAR